MIVDQVYVEGVSVFEAEYDPPVGSNRGRPLARAIASEAMETKARGVHVFDRLGHVQPGQYAPDLIDVFGGKSAPVVLFKQETQPLMPKVDNQGPNVK
jgi:hypothetical protein